MTDGGDGHHRPEPAPLGYAAPEVFFSKEEHTRTRATVGDAIALGILGVGATLYLLLVDRIDAGAYVGIEIMAGAFFAAAAWVSWEWHANLVRATRVTTHGIERHGRVWNWSRITRVGSIGDKRRVALFFERPGRWIWRRRTVLAGMSFDDYQALRVELQHYFATRGIDVVVEREVEVPSD